MGELAIIGQALTASWMAVTGIAALAWSGNWRDRQHEHGDSWEGSLLDRLVSSSALSTGSGYHDALLMHHLERRACDEELPARQLEAVEAALLEAYGPSYTPKFRVGEAEHQGMACQGRDLLYRGR